MKSLKAKIKKTQNTDPLDRDLTDLLQNANWQKVRFELLPKNKVITLRLNENLLNNVKAKAKEEGIDYQKFIRLALEKLILKTS